MSMSKRPDRPSGFDSDDMSLAMRIRSSYHALPAVSAEQVSRCVKSVLAEGVTGRTVSISEHRHTRAMRPRWWWGAAAAAALVVTVTRPWHAGETHRNADSAFAAAGLSASSRIVVGSIKEEGDGAIRFDIKVPAGTEAVSIVGDFNGWDESSTPMARAEADGTWSVKVPLEPGRYTYAFVVDGHEWLVDALAPQVPDAGFGPANALVVEGAP